MDPQDIPVVILAGGMGTRLREQTEFMPKPLVPVGGRPILWHIMKIYGHYGYRRFVICLGYKGEMIKQFFWHYRLFNTDCTINLRHSERITFHHEGKAEDWEITLADTGAKTMTGARIKRIEQYIDTQTFLLTYGDGVADVDVSAAAAFHRAHGRIATVTGVRPPARFGELRVAGDQVVEFGEKPAGGTSMINGGFFVFDRKMFDYLSNDENCTLEKDPLERLAREGQLMVHSHRGFWQCMDTLRDMSLLNEYWESGKAPWKLWDDEPSG
ncbi:MAG: glucose-1-phosphate cytidylyltransferase [Thermodesulfovibrionales bacterium]